MLHRVLEKEIRILFAYSSHKKIQRRAEVRVKVEMERARVKKCLQCLKGDESL